MTSASAARLALLGLVALAATACGGAKLGAPRCTAAQLRFGHGLSWSEATGQHTLPVLLQNVSTRTCALDGYPTIRMLNGRGEVLPYEYTHGGDQMLPKLRPHPVTIRPGGRAVFVMNKYRCDVHWQDFAKTVDIALPGGGGELRLVSPGRGWLDYCNSAPSLTIDVTPILPSLAAARRR